MKRADTCFTNNSESNYLFLLLKKVKKTYYKPYYLLLTRVAHTWEGAYSLEGAYLAISGDSQYIDRVSSFIFNYLFVLKL